MRNAMKKLIIAMTCLVLTACAGGHQYRVDNIDGSYYRVQEIGHTNIARKGAQYSLYELCTKAGLCRTVAERTSLNPTLLEQLAGPGATVGGADILRRGFADSGSTVTNSATGGAGGASGANGSSGQASAGGQGAPGTGSSGCKGNCGGYAETDNDDAVMASLDKNRDEQGQANKKIPAQAVREPAEMTPPVFRHANFNLPKDLNLGRKTGTLHNFRSVDPLAATPSLAAIVAEDRSLETAQVKAETRPATPSEVVAAPQPVSSAEMKPRPAAGAIEVQPGDTLFKVAERLYPGHAHIESIAVALWKNNRNMFIDGNMNGIRAGAFLRLEGLDNSLASLSPRESKTTLTAQWQEWKNRNQVQEPAIEQVVVAAAVKTVPEPVQAIEPEKPPVHQPTVVAALPKKAPEAQATGLMGELRATLKIYIDRITALMG